MSVPQVKDGPASALRAIFAGIGSLLRVADKVRTKPAAEAPAGPTSPAPAAPAAPAAPQAPSPESTAPQTTAEPETTAVPETTPEPESSIAPEAVAEPQTAPEPEPVVAETTAEPEPVVAEATAAPETVAAETTAAETTAAPEASSPLPLANYDELTVASLRARLRNLSVDQLTQLIAYEQGHAARTDVISMFERRIAKLQAEA